MNPDISMISNPFTGLLRLMSNSDVGVSSPLVLNRNLNIEDSSRYFPTFKLLLKKFFFGDKGIFKPNNPSLSFFFPDWIGGMFMLFKSDIYSNISGFDERFFLYYEDVDICIKVWQHGFKVAVDKNSYVVHDARRDSHLSPKFFLLHLQSMIKYFVKYPLGLKNIR